MELPYDRPDRRQAIGDFVADIPVEADHPTRAALDALVARMPELADVPALLVWGPRDPVFTERQLDDLAVRLPRADIQRYPGCLAPGHRGRPAGGQRRLALGRRLT